MLPDDVTIEEFAGQVSKVSSKAYPEVPLLNGFCTLMKRSVLAEVGYLDEATFPLGYGEETDLCIRVAAAGYKLVIADDVYVYHHKSASFGQARRAVLSKQGNAALLRKHPDVNLVALQQVLSETSALIELRKTLRMSAEPTKNQHRDSERKE